MTPAPFTSPLTAPLMSDPEAADILSDRAFAAHMVTVEAALARACASVGLIGADEAKAISDRLATATIDLHGLGAGMASAGVPVPAMVAELRAVCGPAGQGLHWGATSQDVVDCAHVLQWRGVLDLLGTRLSALLDALQTASDAHAATLMAGRTRSQIATPITPGQRMATWAQPLIALEAELPALRETLLRVQFGGASGTASAVGNTAEALTNALAQELGLRPSPCWHLDRTGPQALGGWFVRLCAALGKLAGDLVLSGRSESAELRAGAGGGSSTMPQKSNPVAAETIIALARYCAALQPLLAQAAMPLEERDGTAWALEWLALPQMGMASAAALRHAADLLAGLDADIKRMAQYLDAGHGAVMAEAASFALARHMPRAAAAAEVKQALARARDTGTGLVQVLAQDARLGPLEDWPQALSPVSAQPAADAMRRRIWALRPGPAAPDTPPGPSPKMPGTGG